MCGVLEIVAVESKAHGEIWYKMLFSYSGYLLILGKIGKKEVVITSLCYAEALKIKNVYMETRDFKLALKAKWD